MNTIELEGNLGKDPELAVTRTGKARATLVIADSRRRSGAKEEYENQWRYVTCWNETAEEAVRVLKTGDRVLIRGRLWTNEYEKDGQTRKFMELTAFDVYKKIYPKKSKDGKNGTDGFEEMGTPVKDDEIPF